MSSNQNDRQTAQQGGADDQAQSQEQSRDRSGGDRNGPQNRPRDGGSGQSVGERVGGYLGEAVLRGFVAILGIVLVLLGLGELTGIELYSMVVDFLTSATGQWVVVALIGVLLIGVASRHWGLARQGQ